MRSTAYHFSAYVILAFASHRAAAADTTLAVKARAILKANCSRCHGQESPAKGKFDYILDRDKLVALKKVVPGNPAEPELYQRIRKAEIPPKGQHIRPNPSELVKFRLPRITGNH